tara:strand:- start:7418 stop:9133 length:1716 start_codon:yes stop_codon:yes gene_type:complete
MNASSIKKALSNNHLFSSTSSGSEYIFVAFIVVIAIIVILITWVIYTLNKQFRGCDINPEENKYNNTACMPASNDEFNNNLKSIPLNFYIKTAYNACCGDSYKNTFVNECALDNCINKGARCLDFEIYSYNNEPIIAASSVNNNYIKETYNHLPTRPVLERIKNKCFGEKDNSDPLYLHFRIMSSNKEIYDKLGNQIDSVFGNQLLKKRNELANASYDKFLTDHIINSEYFKNKVIIIVNTKSKNLLDYGNSELSKHVNLISGNQSFNLIRYNELLNKGESNSILIQECKNKFVMVIPDLGSNINNFDIVLPYSNGCQFIAMKFQNYDENLKSYLDHFVSHHDAGTYYSFKLKSDKLRINIREQPTIDHGVTLKPPLIDCNTLSAQVNGVTDKKCKAAQDLEGILINPNDGINSGQLLRAISAAQKAGCDENLISDAFTRSTNISRDDNLISSKLNPSKYIVEKKIREHQDDNLMFEESPKRLWRLYDLESGSHAITTEEREIFEKDICNLFNTKNQIVGLSSAIDHNDKDNEMLDYLQTKFSPNSIEVMMYNTLIKYLNDSNTGFTINSC